MAKYKNVQKNFKSLATPGFLEKPDDRRKYCNFTILILAIGYIFIVLLYVNDNFKLLRGYAEQ